MDENIQVSICCITYNQEKYIKDALDSFIKQKTNFNFEIIIRDDASSDNTPKIIADYAKKFPELIIPIYHKENMYKQGKKIFFPELFNRARGKYIAICEGDDFWLDINKLQKQYDYIENNNECNLYIHNAYLVDNQKMTKNKFIKKNMLFKSNNIYDSGELLKINYCGYIPTASMFFKKSSVKNIPNFYYKYLPEDMSLKLLTSNNGYCYYNPECMSAYRINTGISMVDSWKKEDIDTEYNRTQNVIQLINEFNDFSNKKYSTNLDICIKRFEIGLLVLKRDFHKIKSKDNIKIYKKAYNDPLLIKIFIKSKFERLYILLKNKIK